MQVCKPFSWLFYHIQPGSPPQPYKILEGVHNRTIVKNDASTVAVQAARFRRLQKDLFLQQSFSLAAPDSFDHSELVLVALIRDCPLCPDIPDQCQQTLHLILQRGSQSERAPNRRPRRLSQRCEPDVSPDEYLFPCGVRAPAPSKLGDILPPVRGRRVRNDHDVLECRKRGR
jgi:hypothetical protein